jgi:glyoxylase-like metal-dependent hydrolase (beta-lactamase superfamily II)
MFKDLQRVTPHVWVHPSSPDPTEVQSAVGVVVGEDETLLIDAGNGPKLARHIQAQLEALGAPPVRRILYTHHHWDHVFGAYIYGASALAHASGREALLKMAELPWGPAFLEREVDANAKLSASYGAIGRAVDNWDAFAIVLPEPLAAGNATVHVGDIWVEVRHVGGNHAADSVVVGLPGEGVLFLGDCFYPPPFHLRSKSDTFDMAMLASLVEPTYRFYVDGHNEVATFEELTEWLNSGEA